MGGSYEAETTSDTNLPSDPGTTSNSGTDDPSDDDTKTVEEIITIDEVNGLCINVGNIGCSGTIDTIVDWILWNLSMLPYELEKRGIDLTLEDLNVNIGNLNIKVEGSKIDILDLAISGGGALADPLSLFIPEVQVPAMVIEAVDAAKGTSDLLKGDPSGLLLQATESQLQRVVIVVLKWEQVVPFLGWFGSVAEIAINVGSATTITIME